MRPNLGWNRVPLGVLLLAGLLVGNCAWAVLWPSMLTSLAATLLYLIAIGRLLAANPSALILLSPFVILQLSAIVSLNAIEAGAYMKEMGRAGGPSSASASFPLLSLLLLSTAALVCAYRSRSLRGTGNPSAPVSGPRPFLLSWSALAVAAVVVGYLLVVGVRNGFPLLSGIDRFAFRRLDADVLTLNFLNQKYVLASLLGTGAIVAAGRLQRNLHHLVFALYVALSFLYGDKFFIILVAVTFYGMPYLLSKPDAAVREIRRLAIPAIVVVACVFAVTMYIHSGYGAVSLEATLARLGDRVAGQGQLWYLAVEDSSHLVGIDWAIVQQTVANLFANPAAEYAFAHRLSAFYFVQKYAPMAMYVSVMHNGGWVTPTMVFEAYGLVALGYLGLGVAVVAMGVAVGWLIDWIAGAMMSGNPIKVLLPGFALYGALAVMSQATLFSMLGVSAFKACAAFFVLQVVVTELSKPRTHLDARAA